MGVTLTNEAERDRIRNRNIPRSSWYLLETTSIVEALHFARDNGWKDKEVQVRYETTGLGETYYVEPYEKGCGCKGMLKYKNYFD